MSTSTVVSTPFGLEITHSTRIEETWIARADTVGAEGTEHEEQVSSGVT